MPELQVIARYTVSAGNVDKVLDLMRRQAEASREEPGCLAFDVYRRQDDDQKLVLLERYTSREAFEAHRQTKHFNEIVLAQVVPLLDSREFDLYDPVD